MKIIHKYVLREHVGPLAFALSALTSLMLLSYVTKQLSNLVGKGLPWTAIAEFFLLSIPFTVAMTLPMAVLVSVLFAFSRMASENEITALKGSGVSLVRLLIPVLIAGATLSLLMIVFNDQILPRTNHRLRTLQADIARKKPSFALKEQVINEVAPQRFFLRANHIDRQTNLLREVAIYDMSDMLRRRTIYADSGMMAFAGGGADLQLTLYDGFMQEVPKETPAQFQRLYFEVDQVRVPGVANAFERDSTDSFKSDREMSVCELQNEVGRFERDYYRSYDEYRRASAAFQKDPNASVDIAIATPTFQPGVRAPRSRQASLGRAYCDALVWLESRGFGNLTLLTWRSAADAVLPSVAHAAGPALGSRGAPRPGAEQQGVQEQQRDTLRQRADSIRRAADSTRADSARRAADSTRADSIRRAGMDTTRTVRDSAAPPVPPGQLPPGVTIVDGDTVYSGIITPSQQAPATLDSTGTYLMPPTAPSTGMASSLPAAVALESARAQMLQARAQMNQFAVEIQKKFAISAACIVFVLLGAPLALRFPRGGVGLVIGVSLLVFALYYVGLIAGEALADRAILPPFWAMWAANILFTAVGLLLLARMGSESATSRGGDLSELLDWLKGSGRRRRAARRPVRHQQTEVPT